YELVHYWYHRAAHRFDWLWRLGHQMHHSAESVDAFGAYYLHPLDALLFTTWAVLVFFPLLGLSPEAGAVAPAFLPFNAPLPHAHLRPPPPLRLPLPPPPHPRRPPRPRAPSAAVHPRGAPSRHTTFRPRAWGPWRAPPPPPRPRPSPRSRRASTRAARRPSRRCSPSASRER